MIVMCTLSQSAGIFEMKINPGIASACLSLMFIIASPASFAANSVGQVTFASAESYIERVIDKFSLEVPEGGSAENIEENDVLTTRGGIIRLSLEIALQTEIKVRNGSLQLTRTDDELTCHVLKGTVQFAKKRYKKGTAKLCTVLAGTTKEESEGTNFLVNIKGNKTSVFVIEGTVAVSSTEPEFQEEDPVLVHTGEWLRAEKGRSIPPPQRFRLSDAGSGSSECIYSNCKVTDNILIPRQPVFRPVLLPPPLNPPSRR